MPNPTLAGPPRVKVHAVHVTNERDHIVRTHLQPGGRYWPDGSGACPHPQADDAGVIRWAAQHTDDAAHTRSAVL